MVEKMAVQSVVCLAGHWVVLKAEQLADLRAVPMVDPKVVL